MNSTTVDSLECLKVPGLYLPKTGFQFSTILFQFIVVHGVIQVFHRLIFSHFHVTPFVSQLAAGFFLSPHAPLGMTTIYRELYVVMFPHWTRAVDNTLAMFSYMVFLFLIAVKMDFSMVLRTGRKAFAIGILDLIIPVILCLGFLRCYFADLFQGIRTNRNVRDLYINLTTIPLTHFPNIVVLLADMKMTNTELGRLALSSSLIGHIVSMVLILIATLVTRKSNPTVPFLIPVALLIFGAVVVRPILKWTIKQTPKEKPVKEVFINLGYLFMLMGAWTTHKSGQLVLLGAFIVGSIVPDGPPLGSAMAEKLDFLVSGALLPFFVTTAAMGGSYTDGPKDEMFFYHICLALIAYVSKFATNFLCGLCNNMPLNDALALSFLMCTKGIVDIGTSTMFVGARVLTIPSYTFIVLWTAFVATITSVFVKYLYHPLRKYAGFQKRDVMHLKCNSELRILACIRKSDRLTSITRLLSIFSPSQGNPMIVYALHLMRLVGQAHPIFIAHDMQKKKVSKNSYSEDVVWAFSRFEQKFKNFLSIHVFTSITPFEAMHEAMCTLALDKLVSIILLPFHRRFRNDGLIDFEDNEQRIINNNILNKSPCSVGILVDRGRFGRFSTSSATSLTSIKTNYTSSPLSILVIYIGAHDDQETLALATRIARDPRVKLYVIRLVAFGQSCDLDDLDSTSLRNVMYNKQFTYFEKTVKDGADTANYLKSTVGCYDLVMVGRHYNLACTQLMGLKDLSEDTMLGAIGDFLASEDLDCRTSVLVVQQQRHWAFT